MFPGFLGKRRIMIKKCLNDNWLVYETGKRDNAIKVDVPYDAMLLDEKSADSVTGVNLGWIVPKDYTYEKSLFVPIEWKGR